MKPGTLVAFEGIDGSGKSTQLERLASCLRAAGREPLTTREPTDGEHGRRIRAMARSGETPEPGTELEWFMSDRREHVAQVVAPALAAGRCVLTDRYTLSSVAYQGARGLDPGHILRACESEFPVPDLVILLEVGPETGLARVLDRGGVAEPSFEQADFLEDVRAVFASLTCPYIERVDASGPPDRVQDAVLEVCNRRFSWGLEASA